MGISLGDHYSDCQSNLVFPDVVDLFPTSLDQLKIMMGDFRRSTEKVGLKIHPVKTKILTNQRSNRQSEATIDDIEVDVLPISEKAKYLGQTITFEQKETTEVQSRIRAESEQRGHHSPDTGKSCRRDLVFYGTDFAYSSWSSLPRSRAVRAYGHYHKNTRNCFVRRNGRCSDSSFKQYSDHKELTDDKELAEDERSQQNTTTDSDEGNSTNTGCDQRQRRILPERLR